MTLGSTIKELRRKSNLTQEQLAELLNISASAVSQWETDRVMPDVTQIPVLANIFGVSADVILGIDVERKNEKINKILAVAKMETNNGEFQKAVDILREGYLQYPRSFSIMERLANALMGINSRSNVKDYDEVYSLCNTILAGCTDNEIRYKALDTLATAYSYAGKNVEMLKTVEQMPSFHYSKEQFMLWRWKGEAGLSKRQEYLFTLINEIVTVMQLLAGHIDDNGNLVYSSKEKIELWKQAIAIIEILYPKGDYQFMAQAAESICLMIINTYLRKDDIENAIYWLQRCCNYIVCFDTYDFSEGHTSLAFRGYSDGGWIMENGRNHSEELLEQLENDIQFEIIRNDSRVRAMMEQLARCAKNSSSGSLNGDRWKIHEKSN